ncbi:MAG: prephenate dehydratase [Isosphaeraceae bacterium]|jgi:chorismate mutase/prephenate dehydratase|nr:MAG: prephenate dehydratase [Isosphaeraceae bacterium]
MARKSAKSGSASRTGQKRLAPAESLAALRAEIDDLDQQLVRLLNRRAEIATRIGQLKDHGNLPVWSPAREEEVLARVMEYHRGPLPAETLRLIFRELMSGSRALQRALRVACLGPRYSYSYLASVAKFGQSVEHVPVASIPAVFEEVNRRHVQFGVVPLENSTDGRIADTLEMFARLTGLKIRAEVRLRVRHCLIGKGEWSSMRRVYSKAQALSQCRHWLAKNLPQAQLIEVVSTAHAAELAQRDPSAAAIASRQAADAHGLQVLVENIEDSTLNVTRFAVIAEQDERPTGRDKTTLMVRLPHHSGSLAKAIEPFAKNDVNMTWIESFPTSEATPSRDPTYLFFIDIDGHAQDPPVARSLELLRRRADRLEILGSYPRSDCVEG